MAKKLSDIRETASDAVDILRELRSPEVKESLRQVREVTDSVRGIMEQLKDPSIVKNIESISLTAESLRSASANLQSAVDGLNSSGVLSEISGTAKAARNAISIFSDTKEGGETIREIRETIASLRMLVDELRAVVSTKSTSEALHAGMEAAEDAVKTYRNISE